MVHSYSYAQIEQFKREAKKLCRTTPLTHSQALDLIASEKGFSNWSLLMKHGKARSMTEFDRLRSYRFIRTPDEMREALRIVQLERYSMCSAADEAKAQTEDICNKFITARNAVNFAVEYMQCLLAVPRFKVRSDSRAYWEMHRWLPYAVIPTSLKQEDGSDQYVLVNRKYKPVGHMSDKWADYTNFQHVAMYMSQEHVTQITRPGSSEGYFYRDGSSPWCDRASAQAYLKHLLLLQAEFLNCAHIGLEPHS